jgi:hypothetical protein
MSDEIPMLTDIISPTPSPVQEQKLPIYVYVAFPKGDYDHYKKNGWNPQSNPRALTGYRSFISAKGSISGKVDIEPSDPEWNECLVIAVNMYQMRIEGYQFQSHENDSNRWFLPTVLPKYVH